MVNRVMEAKALKLQRQLRRLPRAMPGVVQGKFEKHSSSAIPARLLAEGMVAPRQPNRELMQGYKHRAASLGREDNPGKFTGKTEGRLAVEEHLQRIKTFCDEDKSFTILDTRVHRARVFYNSQKTAFVLLYENFKQSICRSSLPHCDKRELVDKFRNNHLQWGEYKSS